MDESGTWPTAGRKGGRGDLELKIETRNIRKK
jgi:hypothetical protein